MAKIECRLQGNFNEILNALETQVMKSASASKEDSSAFAMDGVCCEVRVYERYRMMGGNRVSLNITLVGDDTSSYLSAITAGGSQAVLFKLNTFGEEAFLDSIVPVVNRYKAS